jgi:protein-tyrosine phosphatase
MINKTKILFCCMGNICRSPTAEGVARVLAERGGVASCFEFDSAGTHGYHVGDPPDARTCKAAAQRGYDLAQLRARQVNDFDFVRFDRILAMDNENLERLRQFCPVQYRNKLGLFLDFSERFEESEVPDPYYGGSAGFEWVLDLVEDAAAGLLKQLGQR